LSLPLKLSLKSIDDKNPDLVALMYGPRVLFPLMDRPNPAEAPSLTRAQLLGAQYDINRDQWSVTADGGRKIRFLPYTALGDQTYCTYLRVT
jgi:hypothetical protein